ncbi:MAG TPA: MoaD/ThiS family protein [Tepidisphaeraceae bacterium]|jgi:molybdopterin converting factor small subunit
MPVKIMIPAPLRQFTNNAATLDGNGNTVGELLKDLQAKGPGIETRLFKGQTGTLNRFVNIFVNQEDIRFLQNLDTPVKEGDEVSIVAAIAGG